MGFLLPESEEISTPAPIAVEATESGSDDAHEDEDGAAKEDPYDIEGVTAFLAELRDLHDIATGYELELGHADDRAKEARLAVATRLMTVSAIFCR